MTQTVKCLALGSLLLAGASVSANAADWNNGDGSIKDFGGAVGVPVPAPQPIPVYKSAWYFRVDGSAGLPGTAGGAESGALYGLLDTPGVTGPAPFGSSPSWFSQDSRSSVSIGAGAGYRWADQWRTDVTAEYRSQTRAHLNGTYSYNQFQNVPSQTTGANVYQQKTSTFTDPNPPNMKSTYPFIINGAVQDDISQYSGVFLASTYYDLPTFSGFTPYVGAGIGLSYTTLTRSYTGTEFTSCANAADSACAKTPTATNGARITSTSHAATLAAQASAGFSYEISEATLLDLGYRFLYVEGAHGDLVLNGNTSRVSLADSYEHQLRAGLRFNIE